ncbi:uncharacterized protein LOC116138850 [Pistacia vera]|uniref:uncharacterized protein LOC116138850 n=1 Tax=Pistacia vera TaxID=55513 RepID=UPI0012635DBA|nr:uncharacterized protein LOC116138850 [Pistacia vera]
MKNIAESFSASGPVITNEEVFQYVLDGLGPEFDAAVVNLTTRLESNYVHVAAVSNAGLKSTLINTNSPSNDPDKLSRAVLLQEELNAGLYQLRLPSVSPLPSFDHSTAPLKCQSFVSSIEPTKVTPIEPESNVKNKSAVVDNESVGSYVKTSSLVTCNNTVSRLKNKSTNCLKDSSTKNSSNKIASESVLKNCNSITFNKDGPTLTHCTSISDISVVNASSNTTHDNCFKTTKVNYFVIVNNDSDIHVTSCSATVDNDSHIPAIINNDSYIPDASCSAIVGNDSHIPEASAYCFHVPGVAKANGYAIIDSNSDMSDALACTVNIPLHTISDYGSHVSDIATSLNTNHVEIYRNHLSNVDASISTTSNFKSSITDYPSLALQAVSNKEIVSSLWHNRLGHPHSIVFNKIMRQVHSNSSQTIPALSFCDACQLGKVHRNHFPISNSRATKPLELIHSDIWGPAPIASLEGFKYYIHFVDDYSRFTWLFPLRTKAEVKSIFIKFHHLAERQFQHKIHCLQSNQGGEYRGLVPYLTKSGIQFRYSCAHVHQQNGCSERKHRHLVETGLTLLAHPSMPMHLWWFAFDTAAFLINRMPIVVLDFISPYQFNHLLCPTKKSLAELSSQVSPPSTIGVSNSISPLPSYKFALAHKNISNLPTDSSPNPLNSVPSSSNPVSNPQNPSLELIPPPYKQPDSKTSNHTLEIDLTSYPPLNPPVISQSSSAQDLTHCPLVVDLAPSHFLTISIDQPPNINTHPMLTRSKTNSSITLNHSRKTALILSDNTPVLLEPCSVKEALATAEWKEAIQMEFDALKNNTT